MIHISKHIEAESLYELDGLDQRFKRFEAAFGWMLPNPDTDAKAVHSLVLGGELEDSTCGLIEEHTGTFHEIMDAAISVKDRFWLRRIWCDATAIDMIRAAQEIDGLTEYKFHGKDIAGRKLYREKNPETKWLYFRKHEGTTVSLRPIPDFILPEGGIDRYLALAASNKLQVHPDCKQILWCMERHTNPKDIADHPAISAMAAVLWALEEFRERPKSTEKKKRPPLYENF